MRALSYVRASTDKQVHTLEAQVHSHRTWCEQSGVEVVDHMIDADISGRTPFAQRPAGAMLLARAQAERIDLIVTTKVDRVFRNALDGLTCMRETFPRVGLELVAVLESIDTSTPTGKFDFTLKLALAELERDQAAERTQRTSRRLQETGRVYGNVPFGCVAVAGRLFRKPEAWAAREQIVDMLQTNSMREVQMHLRADRVLAPSGGRQWSTSVLKNLRDTHERLALLPRVGEHIATPLVAPPEAQVSPISAGRRTVRA